LRRFEREREGYEEVQCRRMLDDEVQSRFSELDEGYEWHYEIVCRAEIDRARHSIQKVKDETNVEIIQKGFICTSLSKSTPGI
jgi:hypothetical protein